MRSQVLVVALLVVLAACGSRGAITIDPAARGVGKIETVFVGTTREYDPAIGEFGTGRSSKVSLAKYDISVPPDRTPGEIRWPKRGRAPDPQTEFVTTGAVIYPDAKTFERDLHRAILTKPASERTVVIFVHGFNNTFAEGLYRMAQLVHDLEMPGVAVHYSWPSTAKPLGYVHDRDSALYARDGFEKLFNDVIAAGADKVIVVGHSMGSQLLVESLRQMDIRNPAQLKRHLGGVVLLSPDIDVELFRSQAATFTNLPEPFFIFTSNKDKALRLSSFITMEPNRLGNMPDGSQLAGLDIQVIDTTAFSTGSGHFNVATSPELIALLGKMDAVQAAFNQDQAGRPGILTGLVLTARGATNIVLKPVEGLNDALQQ
ncbi:alpha/beta fold hydrolase [Tabrizicola sp. J26]|uniref:alpha/beta hydrolase n=1 Tax=Alitabrizicola rongguiensis TaxID=2909234 RepID=UPI001F422B23|nr:alpha/beta fold hydrolase [Tabrizicola rongguiensis]MCF1708222.1 alpha/beta fold hydrolase [Tabrizicola rongguiensis]